jgi:mono/diheme cytochrome c family protein
MIQKILRWMGILLAVIAGLLLVAAVFVYFRSESSLDKTYNTPHVPDIPIPLGDEAAIQRGGYLVTVVTACTTCHGEGFGGDLFIDDPALGVIDAPNLTTGQNGLGSVRSDKDFIRVLRYGVKPDGTSVRIMPADDYTHLSDPDMAAIIAYIRSLPPVDSDVPRFEIRPLGRTLLALGQLDIMIAARIDFANAGSPPQTPGVTLEYGEYLAHISGCISCHGPGLSGGPIPGAPPNWPQPTNLTPGGELVGWSEADFIQTIRTGINPGGHQLIDEMPWKSYRQMTDLDLKALWLFVSSVPAKEFGNR